MQQQSPLAERMRPKQLSEVIGHDYLVGEKGVLKTILNVRPLPSLILWGPPGSGKTTIARLIAHETEHVFEQLSATLSGVKDIREVVQRAKERLTTDTPTILFLDEIHRFNKAQQDAFLPHVELGTITLIGATTENPSFEINSALLSRAKVFVLKELEIESIKQLILRALHDTPLGLGSENIELEDSSLELIAILSNGDGRSALNTLEIATQIARQRNTAVTDEIVKQAVQKEHLVYDRSGDEHYNTISAFIKSMRAGDADAAIYYLARMVEAGEDPLFIARRMIIFASEDIGLSQPTALVVANEVFRACEVVGYPECSISLAHGVAYLARQKKNRSAYDALRSAQEDIRNHGNLPIPFHIRNAPTKLMQELGYGTGYEMYPENKSYMPDKLKNKKYLPPSSS